MKTHPLLAHDVAMVLERCHQTLLDAEREIKQAWPEQAETIHDCAMQIGHEFNGMHTHGYGLKDFTTCDCADCKEFKYQLTANKP